MTLTPTPQQGTNTQMPAAGRAVSTDSRLRRDITTVEPLLDGLCLLGFDVLSSVASSFSHRRGTVHGTRSLNDCTRSGY